MTTKKEDRDFSKLVVSADNWLYNYPEAEPTQRRIVREFVERAKAYNRSRPE